MSDKTRTQLNIGIHVSKENRPMATAIIEDKKVFDKTGLTMNAVQIFATGPRSYAKTVIPSDVVAINALEFLGPTSRRNIVLHGCYFDHPWEATKVQPVHNINHEFARFARFTWIGCGDSFAQETADGNI